MKVMLVDDSSTMREIQIRMLGELGYSNFVEASDGNEAMTVSTAESPDLILLDWNMPNKNGLEFLKEFRAAGNTTPVVMVTTEAEKIRVVEAIKAGVNSYVIKPFTPDVLKARIDEALQRAA